MSTIAELKEKFAVSGVTFEKGPGELAVITVQTAKSRARIALHGAHLLEFTPAGGRPAIWVSKQSRFQAKQPIRGGTPICWPWFGKEAQPQHGYARIAEWEVRSVKAAGEAVAVTLELPLSELPAEIAARQLYATMTFTVGATLAIALTTTNKGREIQRFTEALHTYFAVSEIGKVRLTGLENEPFLDTVPGREPGPFTVDGPVTVTAELDRNYLESAGVVTLTDDGWSRRIVISRTGSSSAVVWNPWIDKARAMADFGDGEYHEMICIEAANIRGDRVTLNPGESHTLTQKISVENQL